MSNKIALYYIIVIAIINFSVVKFEWRNLVNTWSFAKFFHCPHTVYTHTQQYIYTTHTNTHTHMYIHTYIHMHNTHTHTHIKLISYMKYTRVLEKPDFSVTYGEPFEIKMTHSPEIITLQVDNLYTLSH